MGWTETQRYYAALREVEQQLDYGGTLPWRPGYAEVFGDRDGLVTALARRWRVLVEAWSDLEPRAADELVDAHPGLVALLLDQGSAVAAAPAGVA